MAVDYIRRVLKYCRPGFLDTNRSGNLEIKSISISMTPKVNPTSANFASFLLPTSLLILGPVISTQLSRYKGGIMASYNEQVLIERKNIDSDERETNLEASSPTPGDEYGDTQNDSSDMQRLGKKPEFQVPCRLISQPSISIELIVV